MSYIFAIAPCILCKQLFSFNPHLVPSVRVNGEREPVCMRCVVEANVEREKRGLQLFTIYDGAYEPTEES